MSKRSARPRAAGKSGGPLSHSPAAKGPPPDDAEEAFTQKLMNTPGLAEAYIEATQEIYEKRVKQGIFSTGELQVAKAALDAFHAQMRDVILRKKLCGLATELLDAKKMARNPQVEVRLLAERVKRFQEIEALWQQLPEAMRPGFEILMGQVQVEIMVRMERFLARTMGAEEARRAMGLQEGEKTLDQKRQEARRIHASKTRMPRRGK